MSKVTFEAVRNNAEVEAYLEKADEHMAAVGYTEHGKRHAKVTAKSAYEVLDRLGHPKKSCEMAAIAGYLHDIGNVVGRYEHGQVSAMIAMRILTEMGMGTEDIATIMGAVGNHEEEKGDPINVIAAALILADKSDVHRSRVRNPNMITFDIHDRVNYAAKRSFLEIDKGKKVIALKLKIETKISQVMEYFEIFLSRMVICQRAAKFLKCNFQLIVNNVRLL